MGTGVDHRFNGDCHARKQPWAAAGSTKIGNTGVFMQVRAYSVADELPYHRVTTHLDIPLDGGADIADPAACDSGPDALVQAFPGRVEQRLRLRGDASRREGGRVIAVAPWLSIYPRMTRSISPVVTPGWTASPASLSALAEMTHASFISASSRLFLMAIMITPRSRRESGGWYRPLPPALPR